jgi:phospholipase C
MRHPFVLYVTFAVVAAACSAPSSSPSYVLPAARRYNVTPAGKYIKHVVIIVQENRSFDNFFVGFPGAVWSYTGKTHTGKTVHLTAVPFKKGDPGHLYKPAMIEWDNGKMDGFDEVPLPPGLPTLYAYSYIERSQIIPYWRMAQEYVLADHMFSSEWGASYTAHLQLIAGTTAISKKASIVDLPSANGDCGAPTGTFTNLLTIDRRYEPAAGPYPCYTQFPTIADALDQANVTWHYYDQYAPYGGALWDAFRGIKKVYDGPDWTTNVTYTPMGVIDDAKAGKLAGVSWVIPGYYNSDHPGVGSDTGPSWVASVVNAVGEGPDWKTTAIVVLWDDWGGFYDNVPPPQQYYFGLGFRVGCIVISPYAKSGYVDHTQYEFGSILKTVEQIFGLNSIGTTDARSNSMLNAFDFTQKARKFKRIPAKYPENFFRAQPQSDQPIDTE